MVTRVSATNSNPFSTRYTRPGAIAYLWPVGESPQRLLEWLEAAGWRGEIVGPHGSGKTSLLSALTPALEAAGRRVASFTLHDGQRRMPRSWHNLPPSQQPTLILVDGYEQLSGWSRWLLNFRCRRRGWGLLVTTHVSVGLPTIFRTASDVATAQQLVHQLLRNQPNSITATDVEHLFTTTGGNVRELLFALYDLYEQRRR